MYGDENHDSSLIRSSIIFGIGHAIPALLSFGLISVCAYFLSPSELGVVGLAESAAILVAHISILALPSALRRLYFSESDPRQRMLLISSVLRGGMFIAVAMGLTILSLGPIAVKAIPTDLPDFYPYFAYAIGFQLLYQLLEYRLTIYQVGQRPVPYAVLYIVAGLLIFTFAVYFVAVQNGGALGYLFGRFLAVSLVFAYVLYGLRGYFQFGWNCRKLTDALKYSVPLIPHILALILLNFADRFMLEFYSTTTEVGLYTLAYSIGLAMYIVAVAFNMAWGPFFFQAVEEGRGRYGEIFVLTGKAVALGTSVAIFGVMISGDFVSQVFSQDYHPAARIVPLVITGYFFFFLSSIFAFSILQRSQTAVIAAISVTTVVINIGLNILLIPDHGMEGAAWATVASFGVMALVTYIAAKSVHPLSYPAGKILLAVCCVSIVAILTQHDRTSGYIIYVSGTIATILLLSVSFELPRKLFAR